MPLLREAGALTIIAITSAHKIPAESSTEHLEQYLARSGLPAKVVSLPASKSVHRALLSLVADESLDLLVMGGYGRCRLRERLRGDLSADLLRANSVPVLMSH
ncbi:universal stress protein [Bradyrhizobium sp. USDA 4510]